MSNNIGFESSGSHLFVKSDLVSDFHSTAQPGEENHLITMQTNILQKIDVSVNIYSYIHYRSNNTESFVHQLSGQPITRFNIMLTDDDHNVFAPEHHKQFQCILVFETAEPLNQGELNERMIEDNQLKSYLARHKCGG